jgi:hypothetical protein
MPSIASIRPGYSEIRVACPRDCGNEEVSVVLHEDSGNYTAELSCSVCDADVLAGRVIRPALPNGKAYQTPSWNFNTEECTVLEERAKHAYDNYDPSDAELEASRTCAFPTIAEKLEAARRLK